MKWHDEKDKKKQNKTIQNPMDSPHMFHYLSHSLSQLGIIEKSRREILTYQLDF